MAEERRKNDWEQSLAVVTDQTHHIVVAPVVQCSFCNLSERGGGGRERERERGGGGGGERRREGRGREGGRNGKRKFNHL